MKKALSVCVTLLVLAIGVSATTVNDVASLQDVWTFRQVVNFNTAASNVSKADHAVLQRAAEITRQYPDAIISVEGHTDIRGTAKYNQKLSEQRANAIRNLLISRYGVKKDRVRAKGFGFDYPIAPNDNPAGMARNRRAEIRIFKMGSPNIGSWTPWGDGSVTVHEPQTNNPNVGSYTPAGGQNPLQPADGSRNPNVGNYTPAGDLTPIGGRK